MRLRPRSRSFFVALGLSVAAGALAVACEDNSSGSSGGAFTAPDGSFGSETSSGGPTGEGGPPEGGGQDANVNEPTTPVTLVNMASGYMHGAASADGSAVVVSSPLMGGSEITFSFYEPATGWTAGAPVPGLPVTGAGIPDMAIAMDSKGNAFLAWTQQPADGVATSFYLARYDHATHAWGTVQRPDAYTDGFAHDVAVAANASGDALAITSHSGLSDHDVIAQHFDAASGTWTGELVQAGANGLTNDRPEVHLTDSGKALAIINTTGAVLTRSAAGVWTLASLNVSNTAARERAAINEAGDILIGYEGTSNSYPYVSRYDAAASMWVGPVQLSTEATSFGYGGCSVKVGIAANGDGTYARCYEGEPERTMESYTFTKATGAWSPGSVLPAAGVPGNVSFAFDRAGHGVALYENVGATNIDPSPMYFDTLGGGTWSPQSPALGGNASQVGGAAFMSPNGRGFAAWNEGNDIHAARIR